MRPPASFPSVLACMVSQNVVFSVPFLPGAQIGAGDNVPRLYDLDLEHCTMVMERIVPGMELRHVAMDDDVATRIGAATLRTFWRPVSDVEGLMPQRRVMQPLFDWTPEPELIDTGLVAQAQQLAASLLQRSTQTCLVHGDFHHWNVLQRTSGAWVIIDPIGIVGDPASDIARVDAQPAGDRSARRLPRRGSPSNRHLGGRDWHRRGCAGVMGARRQRAQRDQLHRVRARGNADVHSGGAPAANPCAPLNDARFAQCRGRCVRPTRGA